MPNTQTPTVTPRDEVIRNYWTGQPEAEPIAGQRREVIARLRAEMNRLPRTAPERNGLNIRILRLNGTLRTVRA